MVSTAATAGSWPELQRAYRAVVVVDVVESVRLMQLDETAAIEHWRRLVSEIRDTDLAPHGGRLVKSLGDGLLLEYPDVPSAVSSALAIQQRVQLLSTAQDSERAMRVRIGMHAADVVIDELDIYGAGVNLTARLASLAGPDDIVVSSAVRDRLLPGLDADLEDLGDCWVKHLSDPIRAFRLKPPMPPRQRPRTLGGRAAREALGVAVLPFEARETQAAGSAPDPLGQLLAEDTIAQLSRVPQLRVISHLSTTGLQFRQWALTRVCEALGVDYVIHGSHVLSGDRVRVKAQLVEASTLKVLWSYSASGSRDALLQGDGPLVDQLVDEACKCMVGHEVRRACSLPLPTLASYTILLGAVSLLHSLSLRDFERAREMLVYLIERHPRLATPRAWLGLWHVMRVGQGWSANPASDADIARFFVAAALDLDPMHSLSLAVDGLVCAYVQKDLATAFQRYEAALASNPNEALAWLYRSACMAYREDGAAAVADALHAQSLSPLDPMKYYYDNFTSTAMLAMGNLPGAIDYGRRSLRANRMHGPTLRILAIAHALSDEMDEARATVSAMLQIEPGFSVSAFRSRYPGQGTAQAHRFADALRQAGLPE